MSQKNSENNENRLKDSLLDSYFMFRKNLPETGYMKDNKTTIQIQDELSHMMQLKDIDIITYMYEHGYTFTTEQDGSVSWAIWRMA